MFLPNSVDMRSAEIRERIRELRLKHNYTVSYMANANNIPDEVYQAYENGDKPFNYAFLYTCAQIFSVDVNELVKGDAPDVASFAVTRSGEGLSIQKSRGLVVRNLAPKFKNRLVEPLIVTAEYDPEMENAPVSLSSHIGQEFDYVLEGKLKIVIGDQTEILSAGDSIFYDSSIPHGMVAVDGADSRFLSAMVSPEDIDLTRFTGLSDGIPGAEGQEVSRLPFWTDYAVPVLSEEGRLESVSFKNTESFNFAFDIVDRIADAYPNKTALVHISEDGTERRLSFKDIKRLSGRAANYLTSIGIRKGDVVMLILRRAWQYWPLMIALCKIGAIAAPVTWQISARDLLYRFRAAKVGAVIACCDDEIAENVNLASIRYGRNLIKVSVGGAEDGWCDFDGGFDKMSSRFFRTGDSICGYDKMLMIFQSYADSLAQPVIFDCRYPLVSFLTGKYWNNFESGELSLFLSDTAWTKALWGKLYGPWMNEAGVFAYDFRTLKLGDLLNYLSKYRISSFSAPSSLLRALVGADLNHYDLSALKTVCTVGDSMSLDVYNMFKDATGLSIRAGYGQAETSLLTGFFGNDPVKPGSIGRANPLYDIRLLDADLNEVGPDEPGEICISLEHGMPIGLMTEVYRHPEFYNRLTRGGYLHIGDLAWKDEDGYFWSIGRIDDIIKCAGYRISPTEVEDTIMELPYVLECGVTGVPDEIRGQIVKAGIVLIPDKEPSEDLKTEIQEYVRHNTASYRYPRIVEFRSELPKTRDGRVIRNRL